MPEGDRQPLRGHQFGDEAEPDRFCACNHHTTWHHGCTQPQVHFGPDQILGVLHYPLNGCLRYLTQYFGQRLVCRLRTVSPVGPHLGFDVRLVAEHLRPSEGPLVFGERLDSQAAPFRLGYARCAH